MSVFIFHNGVYIIIVITDDNNNLDDNAMFNADLQKGRGKKSLLYNLIYIIKYFTEKDLYKTICFYNDNI